MNVRGFAGAQRARILRGKGIKYLLVSVLSLGVAQTVLFLLFGVFGWTARSANSTAFLVGAIPSYHLNRSWTWGRSGPSHLLLEVLPFWAIALFGLGVSTVAAEAGEEWAKVVTSSRVEQGLIVSAASLATCSVVWLTRFVAFDKLVFVVRTQRRDPIELVGDGLAEAPDPLPGS